MKRALCIFYKILLWLLAAVFILIALGAAFLLICDAEVVKTARVLPPYAQTDITQVLEKEEWTDEDYNLLYHQTGLGKSALDELKGDSDRILEFQTALFFDGTVIQQQVAFTTKHDMMQSSYTAPIVDLQNGDVIVTSSCHTFGWRNGHSAIVINGKSKTVLESKTLGENSRYGNVLWFQQSANFIVLRLKDATQEERAEIAAWANNALYDVEYSIMVGISYPKDQGDEPQVTHCSHLVWQAYYHFGYDIDPDGGPVATSRDIASSPYFEVVQVYGFDPDELW